MGAILPHYGGNGAQKVGNLTYYYLLSKFAALVEKVEALKQKQRASETELRNLFGSLMQRAFRGELVN